MPLLLVASPKGGVGKTTISAGLADAFARTGRRVIALDLDPQNALRLHFGVPVQDHAGFLTALPRGQDWRAFLRPTESGVLLLPHGGSDLRGALELQAEIARSPEILAGPVRLMLGEPDTIVLADLPPGASPVLAALSPLASLLLVVLLPDSASTALLPDIDQGRFLGRGTLAALGAPPLRFVLNQVDHHSPLSRRTAEAVARHLGPRLLGAIAREHRAHLVIGVIERDQTFSRGTLYCTLLYFGPDGALLAKHRKLVPTAAERYIWGSGDGSTLPALETPHGRLGGLICWENYMPLARMAMYGKGVQVYLAPTADHRDTWQATLRHIACEGRCFVLGSNQFVTKDMYPPDLVGLEDLEKQPEVLCRGGSAIVSPLGEYLAGPSFDEEALLVAELDLAEVVRARFDFDVVGHYARPDVFTLIVNEHPLRPLAARS